MLLDLRLQQMNLILKKIDGYSPLFIDWSTSQRRKTDSHHKSFLCAPPVLIQTDCTSRVIWKLTVSRSSLQMKSSCYKNDLSSRWPFWHLSAKGKLRFGTSRWLWRGTSGSWRIFEGCFNEDQGTARWWGAEFLMVRWRVTRVKHVSRTEQGGLR